MTLPLANPHQRMTGLARLDDHTLWRLSVSCLLGGFLSVLIVLNITSETLPIIVAYIILGIGYVMSRLADSALRKRNAAWRPLRSPVKIIDIKHVLTSYDSKPGQPQARLEIKFEGAEGWYELQGTLPNYVGTGSYVLGDISLGHHETRLLHTATATRVDPA